MKNEALDTAFSVDDIDDLVSERERMLQAWQDGEEKAQRQADEERRLATVRKRMFDAEGNPVDACAALEKLFCAVSEPQEARIAAIRMLERYRTLRSILRASPEELRHCRIMLPEQMNLLLSAVEVGRRGALDVTPESALKGELTPERIAAHLAEFFENSMTEKACILCLDGNMQAVECFCISDGIANCVAVHLEDIRILCRDTNTKALILIHNHICCGSYFSHSDYVSTASIFYQLTQDGIILSDHLLVENGKVHSMLEEGFMTQLVDRIREVRAYQKTINSPHFVLPPWFTEELILPFPTDEELTKHPDADMKKEIEL